MKSIKVKFVDHWSEFNPSANVFMRALSERFDVRLDEDPEYLFFSAHGFDYLEYDVPRIFFTQENLRPDFNTCDYALAFDRMTFGDRYFRFPLYLLERQEALLALSAGMPMNHEGEKEFCNFVVSNGTPGSRRDEMFHLLSAYKKVDSAGAHLNNVGYKPKDKIAFQSKYKFSIAFENSSTPGYTTEKLIDAAYAGTVPIYWGDPDIGLDFYTEAFVNCGDYPSLEAAARRVIELDQDDNAYRRVRDRSILRRPLESYSFDAGFETFFYNIFEQNWNKAFRRNRVFWGVRYEEQLRDFGRFVHRRELWFPKIIRRFMTLGLVGTLRRTSQKIALRLFGKAKGVLPER